MLIPGRFVAFKRAFRSYRSSYLVYSVGGISIGKPSVEEKSKRFLLTKSTILPVPSILALSLLSTVQLSHRCRVFDDFWRTARRAGQYVRHDVYFVKHPPLEISASRACC
jgi:hypothetical protein